MSEDHRKVAQAIEDRFFEEERLSDKQDIIDWTNLPENRVNTVIEQMVGNGLVTVYEKRGSASIYLTQRLFTSLNAQAGEPDWIDEFEFPKKSEYREQIREATEEISEFQTIERLLYASGDPLEKSVKHCLELLEFSPESTEADEDFIIRDGNEVYVIEVKGVGRKIKKSDVTQLGGWLDKIMDEGVEPENLTGMLLHNHDRHTHPDDRGYPLTEQAERFLKLRQSIHVSTTTLFQVIKRLTEGEKDIIDAQEKFLEGDPYDD